MKTVLRLLPALAVAALLGACATTSTKPGSAASSSQEALLQRAQQRWDYLIAHQAEKAWDYLTPGYRATVTQAKYADGMNNRPLHWSTAKVNKADCAQPDSCMVQVVVTYQVTLPGMAGSSATGFAPLKEQWLLLQNQWYYLPREEGGNSLKATH
jgi:hypothetical protein